MAYQEVDRGSAANAGDGEPPYDGFGKINDNFVEVYADVAAAEVNIAALQADMTTAESDIDTLQASMVTAEGSIDDLLDQLGNGVISSTVTTKQNDYAPTGWAACRVLRWNGAGSTGITGFDSTGIADGAEKTIVNASTDYLLWLENQNTASAAASRMMLPDSFPAFLMPGDTLTLIYDLTTARWQVKEWPTRGQAMGLTAFCDYLDTVRYMGFFGCDTGGAGAAIATSGNGVSSAERAAGVMSYATGTTTTGRAGITGAGAGTGLLPALGSAIAVSRVSIGDAETNGTDTFADYEGFIYNNTGLSNAMCWERRWNGAAAEWSYTAANNGSISRSTAGAPSPSTDYLCCVVFVNPAWTRADFIFSTDSIAYTLAGSHTTNLPAGVRNVSPGGFVEKTAGTSSRRVTADYHGYRLAQVRA